MLKSLVFELFKTPKYGDSCCFNMFNIDLHYFDRKIDFSECEDILKLLNEELATKPRWESIDAICKKYNNKANEYIKHLGECKVENKSPYIIDIENCDFIKRIILFWHEINAEMEIKFYPKSRLRNYYIDSKIVEIDIDSHINITLFNFNYVRYSLYLVYYKYLLETNPNHLFVNFFNFINTLVFEIQHTHYMTFNRYIDNVDTSKDFPIPKKLSEKVFISIYNYVSSYFESLEKTQHLDFGYRY